jgi:hypothetical protein
MIGIFCTVLRLIALLDKKADGLEMEYGELFLSENCTQYLPAWLYPESTPVSNTNRKTVIFFIFSTNCKIINSPSNTT